MMRFQIFKDDTIIYYDDGEIYGIFPNILFRKGNPHNFNSELGKELTKLVQNIMEDAAHDIKEWGGNPKATDYGYIHRCLGCDKIDYLVHGFCKGCFDQWDMKYWYEV